MATMKSLWSVIQSMSLTTSNKQWLAEKLVMPMSEEEKAVRSAIRQVKALKEGTLETRDANDLLNEL